MGLFGKKESNDPEPNTGVLQAMFGAENPHVKTYKILKDLEKWKNLVGQAPSNLIDQLFQLLDPGYKCLGLEKCGGEGFIFHAFNALRQEVAVKILYVEDYPIEAQRNVIRWQEKTCAVEVVDPRSSRFLEGIKIQDVVYQASLKKEAARFFSVPAVKGWRTNPVMLEMEWVFSKPVLQWFKEENVPIITRLEIFENLLQAICFIHNMGFVHRDLKSDNILMGENNTVCIVDWSFSKEVGVERNLTARNIALGAVPYISPVQKADARQASFLDDIHCLGYVLVDFILGVYHPIPGDEKEPYESRLKKYRNIVINNKGFPQAFHELFLKATEINPNDRFASVEEFLQRLIRVIFELDKSSESRQVLQLPKWQFPKFSCDPTKMEKEKQEEANASTIIMPPMQTTIRPLSMQGVIEIAKQVSNEMVQNCPSKTVGCQSDCFLCAKLNRDFLSSVGIFLAKLREKGML